MTTIIKGPDGYRGDSSQNIQRVAFSFGDLAHEAEGYVQQVRRRAAQIVLDAKQQADAIRRNAEQEGRQAAEQTMNRALDEKLSEQLETLYPALREAIQQIQDAKQSWLTHWQANAVAVAASIARRVIRRELSCQPEITMDWIQEALELAAGSADITLRLNPQDYEALGQHVERMAAELGKLSPSQIVADPDISPGGCRVDTKFGSLDQQVESQLARLEEELT